MSRRPILKASQLIAHSALLQALNQVRGGRQQRLLLQALEQDNMAAARKLAAELGKGRLELWWWSPDTELPDADPACGALKASLRQEPYFRDLAAACAIGSEDLHAADPHVNPAGYAKLTACFAEAIEAMVANTR